MNSENFLREKKDKQIKNRAKKLVKTLDAFNKGPFMYYVIPYKGEGVEKGKRSRALFDM